jgi:hypothetical protein
VKDLFEGHIKNLLDEWEKISFKDTFRVFSKDEDG